MTSINRIFLSTPWYLGVLFSILPLENEIDNLEELSISFFIVAKQRFFVNANALQSLL